MNAAPRRALLALGAGVLGVHGLLLAPRDVPLEARPEARRFVLTAVAGVAPRAEPAIEPVAPQLAPTLPPPTPPAVVARRAVPRAMAAPTTVPTARPLVVAPPLVLRYRVVRGVAEGEAELRWQPDGGRYEAALRIDVPGGPTIEQTSTGTIGAAGLAPVRFVDRRPRRALAVNFQPERGVVGFSAASLELPLVPGAQDRLSWLLQLATVVDADPAGAASGVRLPVFGPRGDGGTWHFEPVGGDAADGHLHLRRAASGPYDAAVEVWLDPARHHLPARLRLDAPSGAALELELTER